MISLTDHLPLAVIDPSPISDLYASHFTLVGHNLGCVASDFGRQLTGTSHHANVHNALFVENSKVHLRGVENSLESILTSTV